jgi:DNA-binding response OmpR family regulator
MNQTQILIIEDDPAVAQSLQAGLIRESFNVALASNAKDGIAYIQKNEPHLLLLDLRLPDDSGFDVCRKLRQVGFNFPIIILTAQHDTLDKVLGLEIGADDYITKPYNLRELVSRIRAQLRRAYGELSNADTNHLLVNDVVIDLSSGQALRNGLSLNLTPTEFKLLAFLVRHRGQVLSRSQMVEAVWGHGPDPESEQSVKVHVHRLREKIENDPSHPELILTVPGLGYRLASEITKL